MRECKIVVKNRAGIHCRPASVILNTINAEFPGVRFELATTDGEVTELNSILALISLGLQPGQSAVLRVEGGDEEKAIQRISGLFAHDFDFPPK